MNELHSHHHGTDVELNARAARVVNALAIAGFVLVLIGVVFLRPGAGFADLQRRADNVLGFADAVYSATVVSAQDGTCAQSTVECRTAVLRLNAGPDEGTEFTYEVPRGELPYLRAGESVVVSKVSDAGPLETKYVYSDRDRKGTLVWVAVLFAISVIALGRWRGLTALIGLGLSLIVVITFMVPAILTGRNAVLVALVASCLIAYLALYLANGFRSVTSVALIGTIATLMVVVALAAIFTGFADLSGVTNDETSALRAVARQIDFGDLLFAGFVIAALGALDDMTVTQAAAVTELRAADPHMSRRALFRAAMRIGREHVSSTVNTLALAYVGASLPLVLLFVLSGQAFTDVANSEDVATAIIGALVGSIGIVASVPITTWIGARVVSIAAHEVAHETDGAHHLDEAEAEPASHGTATTPTEPDARLLSDEELARWNDESAT